MSQEDELKLPVREIINRFNNLVNTKKTPPKLDIRNDKEKLLAKLEIKRNELEAYIRHSRKLVEEKLSVERENSFLKIQIDVNQKKMTRLERSEGCLRNEFSHVCRLLNESGHPSRDNYQKYQFIEDSIVRVLTDSSSTQNTNFVLSDLEHAKQETAIKRKILSELQREIYTLSDKREKLTSKHIKADNQLLLSSDLSLEEPKRVLGACSESIDGFDETFSYIKTFFVAQIKKYQEVYDSIIAKSLCKTDASISPALPELTAFIPVLNDISFSEYRLLAKEYEKILEFFFETMAARCTYLDAKAYEFRKQNESLIDDIQNLKYALTHRMEVDKLRLTSQNVSCECSVEINSLKNDIQRLQKDLKNKETELEVAEDNKRSLLELMAFMSNPAESNEQNNYSESLQDFSNDVDE